MSRILFKLKIPGPVSGTQQLPSPSPDNNITCIRFENITMAEIWPLVTWFPANALELLQYCTQPSIYSCVKLTRGLSAPHSFLITKFYTYIQFLSNKLLWPSYIIWCHESWSTLVQLMAWCLMASSHYLDQYWLIIKSVLWSISQEVSKISICKIKSVWKVHL